MNITIGTAFEHQDHPIDKRRRKFVRLVIHKIDDSGAVVAHRDGDEADERGYWPEVFYFPKGLDERDVKWLETEPEIAFVPQIIEADVCVETWL